MEIFEKEVTVRLLEPMLGTVAMDKEVFKTYIESKKPAATKEDEAATLDNTDKTELSGWTGFHKDDKGLFVYDYFIKGFFKHAGNTLKAELDVKALKSKLDDYLFIEPRRIYLGVMEADDVLERPIRAMTPMGPRVSLIRSDLVNKGTEFTFIMKWLKHPAIKEKLLDELLEYGKLMGFGQFRNGGYGRFEVVKPKKTKKAA